MTHGISPNWGACIARRLVALGVLGSGLRRAAAGLNVV